MSGRRRFVLVGRGLRPGRTLDDAIDAVCSVGASADVAEMSTAVLDQVAGPQGLAVSWRVGSRPGAPDVMDLLAMLLTDHFASVRVVEDDAAGLAESVDST